MRCILRGEQGKLLPGGFAGGRGFRPIEAISARNIGKDKTGGLPCFIFFMRGGINDGSKKRGQIFLW